MADLGIIFLRRKHTIYWYQSLFTVITGSMPFRYFWATLYIVYLSLLETYNRNNVTDNTNLTNSQSNQFNLRQIYIGMNIKHYK